MNYIVFLILCFILFSCKKDVDEPNIITITGVVSDQVTGEPVEGATVSAKHIVYGMPYQGEIAGQSVSTDPEGRYELKTSGAPPAKQRISPGQYLSSVIQLSANKSGYVEGDRFDILLYGDNKRTVNLSLYHNSELNLRIKNDTTNSIDTVEVKFELIAKANHTVGSYIGTAITCNKKKLDSIYLIKNLIGNGKYGILVVKPGAEYYSTPIKRYSVILKPDTINNFDISF